MVTTLLAALAIAQTSAAPPALLASGTGNYHRAVHTVSPRAKAYFDQGLAMLYAFHKATSVRSFDEATRIDPDFAMAYWGKAMALGPDINVPAVASDASWEAISALDAARATATTEIEKDLIRAARMRFTYPANSNRKQQDKNYSDEMAKLYADYPNDPDIACLYAESIMILSPWDQWNSKGEPHAGTLTAVAAIEKALKLSPDHLMANHLYVHVLEASPHPEKALGSADKLVTLAPAFGHLVHMPSHTYVRTGRWAQAIVQNERANASDGNFFRHRDLEMTYAPYMLHNRMMLSYAACMNGDEKKAMAAMDELKGMIPPEVLKDIAPLADGVMWMPYEVEKRFGKWDLILAEPAPPTFLPLTSAMRFGDRAIAQAAKGKFAEADAEFQKFKAARKKVPAEAIAGLSSAMTILDIEENLVAGEIALQRGQMAASIKSLKEAVKFEGQLHYDEPPDWIQPVRHTLGVALLAAHQPREALAVYRADLALLPNNAWSLLGTSQAYAMLGQPSQARSWKARYAKVWTGSSSASSSCLCMKGK